MSNAPANCFFSPADGQGRYLATELTRGPWSEDAQHAGPPLALLATAIERFDSDAEQRTVARLSYEILRPIPIGELELEVSVRRGGRSVELLEAVLREPGGADLVLARAWRLRRRELEIPAGLASLDKPGAPASAGRPVGELGQPHGPDGLTEGKQFFPTSAEVGYHTAMEYRFARGGFMEPGPATAWLRMRHPLIAGEPTSPLARVVVAADSGNGVSATLDINAYVFINVDLTVNLHREPVGEWVCLDAITVPEPNGVGLADSMLWDQRGPIGRATQTLLIDSR